MKQLMIVLNGIKFIILGKNCNFKINFLFSEVKEESGLNVISMNKIGVLEFEFDGSKELLEVHLYTCKQFSGNIIESDG